MLNSQTINKIEEYVYSRPRSIQEIADHLKKNWRTADRYVQEIEKNFGTLSTRVFREGTRGALKVVYWASVEKASRSIFQEKLEHEILQARKKEDFSPFDIFQFIPENKKSFSVENSEEENLEELIKILNTAQKQILFFSGNLSFINLKQNGINLSKTLEELIRKKVFIKVLCRVDLDGKENIEKLLSLNLRTGENLVEVRHDFHPIRAFIIDGKFARIKEIKEPTGKVNELNKKAYLFYNITDKGWIDWLSKIFWKKFSNSMDAQKRLEQLKKMKI